MLASAIRCVALTGVALLCFCGSSSAAAAPTRAQCEQLGAQMTGHWPDSSTRLISAQFFADPQPAKVSTPGAPPLQVILPPHCEISGVLHERKGADGQLYAIHFHLRLPTVWNKRFYFQGGGGTNGEVGDALGALAGATPALMRGYAVVSQDSGHDNRVNLDTNKGGRTSFGFDAQARADYGHASLQPVSAAAKALVHAYYGVLPEYSYFVGCSKGGEEGMVAAQRLPLEFNGILAAAPGFSLPRAAVAEAWDVQSLASVAAVPLARTFSDSDLALVSRAVLDACDADDGLVDGIVGAFQQCSTKKVNQKLQQLVCARDKGPECLSSSQIAALKRVYAGPRNSKGQSLYSDWPWDAGISSFGWRLWKLGSADGAMQSMNVTTGGASLASVFTTPPTALPDNTEAQLRFAQQFDFDRDAPKIYATIAAFPSSAWDDISARSSDLSGFRAHGGRLLVPHGVSDPVFSLNDTLAWYRDLERRTGGKADTFVRVFPVPGMNHCGGGPATDRFDAFASLVGWVEHQQPPDRILARAGAGTPWPGRERPLCPYPKVARYKGSGNIERADNFDCR